MTGDEAQDLNARIAELERRNGELQAFGAAVAHELQAPLIALERYAAEVAEQAGDALDDQVRADLDVLTRGMARVRVLANTLLEHARSNHFAPAREPFELGAVVADCVALLRPEIEARGARVTFDDLPVVRADARLVATVLQNLLVNALRYGPRGHGLIAVAAERRPDAWRVSVRSDGSPISAQESARIFEPYERGHGERRGGGVGLGLAICRLLVESDAGQIGVEPLADGNRFFFTVPD